MITIKRQNRKTVNIFDDLEFLRGRFNQLFNQGGGEYVEFPPMNVWASEKEVIVDIMLPGINPDNIDISIEENLLTLVGNIEDENRKEKTTCCNRERHYGSFSRSLQLLFKVVVEKITAKYTNGILRVTLPRLEADKPIRVKVE